MKYYNNLKLFDFKLNLRLILSVPRKGNVPLRVMIVTVYTIVYFLLTNKYQISKINKNCIGGISTCINIGRKERVDLRVSKVV